MAMLPLVVVLGGVMIEVVTVSSFIAYSVGQVGYGEKLSSEAYSTAYSGAVDAIRKIIRNKDFYDSGGYTLTVGERSAVIVVVKDYPDVGKTRITSTATALFRQRKIQADVKINTTTGKVDVISFEEISL